ncbi:MAG: hypothetical protein H7175_14980 [Burkholderiales bacterium]|nr:hypothetical protein [Anaerolineae bacterium]
MKKFILAIAVLMLAFSLAPITALAQDTTTLNFGATDTNFGSVTIATGFLPDPYIVTLISGGPMDVSTLNLGADCRGYATSQPDFRINWTGPTNNLRFFFVGAGDATMIVNDAAGNWLCNDDGDGLNPVVNVPNAATGQYDVWIGSFSQSDLVGGYLIVTELNSMPSAILSPILITSPAMGTTAVAPTVEAPVPPSTTGLDFALAPNFGTAVLASGFVPDPNVVPNIISGGSVDVTALNLGTDCRGYATSAPDYRITWTGTSPNLRVFFVAATVGQDATLIVNAADGNWYCSDDTAGGLNPTVNVPNAVAGQYDIWVGSFSATDRINGTLYITELAHDPANPGA